MTAALSDITGFIDALLDIKNVTDWANALNGLQLANTGKVTRIGAAVDAGEATLNMAQEAGIDLLLVHHGLFWPGLQPLTGPAFRKVSLAIHADMAVYSAHLPLDIHPTLGNNVLLAQALGLARTEPFFFEKGRFIGVKASAAMTLDELVTRLEHAVAGPVKVFRAASEGVDTFITGEGPHHAAIDAQELGVNLLLAGHYATETFGVKALAMCVAGQFSLPWQFIDYPTGL